eukprot:TRINITY_DN41471_c0_g1_i1.p2 TRINITY_DN41471_c0_g1~~TRINITY_DN41471_c0_g1_i1.p2  ORF type:complete len:117 (+),score=11.03 TRINITY_DN41471_c0_g1_i1:280-630(+)
MFVVVIKVCVDDEDEGPERDFSTAILADEACSSLRLRSLKHLEQKFIVAGLPKKPQLFAHNRWPSCAWHLCCSSAIFDFDDLMSCYSLRFSNFLNDFLNLEIGLVTIGSSLNTGLL